MNVLYFSLVLSASFVSYLIPGPNDTSSKDSLPVNNDTSSKDSLPVNNDTSPKESLPVNAANYIKKPLFDSASSQRWFIFTGGPSTGKTSVLNELKKRGHSVIAEAATDTIQAGLDSGMTAVKVAVASIEERATFIEQKCCSNA